MSETDAERLEKMRLRIEEPDSLLRVAVSVSADDMGFLFELAVRALIAEERFYKLMTRLQPTHDAHRIGPNNREMCVCPLCVEYRRACDEQKTEHYACNICSARFATVAGLEDHLIAGHDRGLPLRDYCIRYRLLGGDWHELGRVSSLHAYNLTERRWLLPPGMVELQMAVVEVAGVD